MNYTRTHYSYADDANMTVAQLRARCNDVCPEDGGHHVEDLMDEIRSRSPNMATYRITCPDAHVTFHEYWSDNNNTANPQGNYVCYSHPLLASYWDAEEIARRGCECDLPFCKKSDGSVMFKCSCPIDDLIGQVGEGVDWSTLEKISC